MLGNTKYLESPERGHASKPQRKVGYNGKCVKLESGLSHSRSSGVVRMHDSQLGELVLAGLVVPQGWLLLQ